MASRPTRWRILAVLDGMDLDAGQDEKSLPCGALQEFTDLAGSEAEMLVVRGKTLEEVRSELARWRPNLVYLDKGTAPAAGAGDGPAEGAGGGQLTLNNLSIPSQDGLGVSDPEALAERFEGVEVDAVYVNAFATAKHADALREAGVAHVVYWDGASKPAPDALACAHFGHAFFATLRNRSATIPEAFAMALHSAHAHCGSAPGARPSWQPELVSDFEPLLPSIDSVPLPVVPGADFKSGVAAAVPGWESVRLLAPHAELRLLAAGQSSLIDAHRLSYLGEALRALLVLEVRQLALQGRAPCERTPAHLPPGATASRCSVRAASGAHATVVLGGPPSVLAADALVEYALRQTLVADAVSLQFRLPPPGVPAPAARRSASVVGGAPVVDALAVTSVWAVHLLRALCLDARFRGLVALGIGAVGNATVAAFGPPDSSRYSTLVAAVEAAAAAQQQPGALANGSASGMQPPTGPSAPSGPASISTGPAPMHPDQRAAFAAANASVPQQQEPDQAPSTSGKPEESSGAPTGEQANGHASTPSASVEHSAPKRMKRKQPAADVGTWQSKRARMAQCSEREFLEDLCSFHRECSNRPSAAPDTFPDAILNGTRLDLYNLYKEVTSRGGFQVGNGINWKGQVFPAMANYTAHNRMTGVGNALKRHYILYLLDYEQAHPEDVQGDVCGICGGGNEAATDWISCDACSSWVHFSCDERPDKGVFKDYVKGGGKTFACPNCANRQGGQPAKRAKTDAE